MHVGGDPRIGQAEHRRPVEVPGARLQPVGLADLHVAQVRGGPGFGPLDPYGPAVGFGNLSAFYFYSYVAVQIPTGLLADRWGPRRTAIWLSVAVNFVQVT